MVFRNTLTMLLSECVDVQAQKALLNDVAGTRRNGGEVEEARRHRRKNSYTSSVDHVASVRVSLKQLSLRLDIGAKGKVCLHCWGIVPRSRLTSTRVPSIAPVPSSKHIDGWALRSGSKRV